LEGGEIWKIARIFLKEKWWELH
jgi:hypothetical protein